MLTDKDVERIARRVAELIDEPHRREIVLPYGGSSVPISVSPSQWFRSGYGQWMG